MCLLYSKQFKIYKKKYFRFSIWNFNPEYHLIEFFFSHLNFYFDLNLLHTEIRK